MCLIVVAWQTDPEFDLIVAANRDEFHDRPARSAYWWPSVPGLFAGQDCVAGGAWCGAGHDGRFAAVTNVRDTAAPMGRRSRGGLVRDYFINDLDAGSWASRVQASGNEYAPFNLLIGDRRGLYFVSNRDETPPRRLPSGIWAISNGHWGQRWPKTERATAAMDHALKADRHDPESLLALLYDDRPAPEAELPDTGIDRTRERFLSSIFIRSPQYGTRAATVIRRRPDRSVEFTEQGFDRTGQPVHRVQQTWLIETCST
ncbi:NRDE family protein [Salinisphaera sp. Q1T1-3]|uniref:NRDE family protein n=1 Tax=Salinisphaera sp. Q1T1-3 TaxID=2321229 RepID=UPI000E70F89C|nr:NRDE family protein [Salinisphaera sp. Q1T1-3]RJS92556.1 NRDE family protein [Salinisphaera sp. Q1T1-3]